jgi:hypothetical protein
MISPKEKFFLCFVAAISLLLEALMPEVEAMPISYRSSPRGAILQARLPLTSIGTLKLPNGQLELIDKYLQIRAIPEALFDSRTVLSGVVLKANKTGQTNERNQTISALVYLFAGTWLNYLGPEPVSELVETQDGKIIAGRIIEGSDESLSLSGTDQKITSIDIRNIANVKSPRAFWLKIPITSSIIDSETAAGTSLIAQASSAMFAPTFGQKSTTSVPGRFMIRPLGDEKGMTNWSFAAYLMADVAAFVGPAIALPLAIEKRNLTTKRKYQAFNQGDIDEIDNLQNQVNDLKSSVDALATQGAAVVGP